MTFQPVEAVFFWRYGLTVFRAIYGRFPGNLYTKDYLQSSGRQKITLDDILGRQDDEVVPIEYRWPNNVGNGNWRKSAADDRGQLAWLPMGNAPSPWKIGVSNTHPERAIPGNPEFTTEQEAEEEWQHLDQSNVDPWIVAVKLHNESNILHVRSYLGIPTDALAHKSINQLPRILQDEMRRLPRNISGGAVTVTDYHNDMRNPKLVKRIIETLKREYNVLLVGPPGTGKTVALEDLRSLFEATGPTVLFDPDLIDNAWAEGILPPATDRKVVSLVFHPSYSYENFVAGLVPKSSQHGFSLISHPGPLLALAHWSVDAGKSSLLIIDEFNRGSAAAIFGDTLALLDKDKRANPAAGKLGASIERPYPDEIMAVGEHYMNAQGRNVEHEIRLPSSLWILAALNSTDRSVAPLDAALRRRFAIIYVGPDYEALAEHLGIDNRNTSGIFPERAADWTPDNVKQLAVNLLQKLNDRIDFVLGRDFLLGHALLWAVEGNNVEELAQSLSKAFDERIAATLRLTFVDQDEALGAIFKAPLPANPRPPRDDVIADWVFPPDGLQNVSAPRLNISETSQLDWKDALLMLRSLL